MNTPHVSIPFYYVESPHLHPTSGQILALGYLMAVHHVYVMPDISYDDLADLAAMRLCHPSVRNHDMFYRYDISHRLLREWAPYHRFSMEWHRAYKYLTEAAPPSFILTEDNQVKFANSTATLTEFMKLLIQECGRAVASHWTAWKMEDHNHAQL